MLDSLEEILQKHFANNYKKLKDVEYSCCIDSDVQGYYFDGVKEDFFKRIGVKNFLKSVDFLHITNPDTMYLVEMTSYKSYSNRTSDYDCHKFVNNELSKEDLRNKIIDSLLIALAIAGYYDIDKRFYSFYLDLNRLNVKTILLVDISPMELTTLSIAMMHKKNISITKRVGGETEVFNCEQFDKFFKSAQ